MFAIVQAVLSGLQKKGHEITKSVKLSVVNMARSYQGQAGVSLKRVVVAILLAFVGFIFIINFTPTIEKVSTVNITNDLTKTMADMGIWLLPVGGLVGVFYGVFKLFGGGKKED